MQRCTDLLRGDDDLLLDSRQHSPQLRVVLDLYVCGLRVQKVVHVLVVDLHTKSQRKIKYISTYEHRPIQIRTVRISTAQITNTNKNNLYQPQLIAPLNTTLET